MGVLESPEKVLEFCLSEAVGTLCPAASQCIFRIFCRHLLIKTCNVLCVLLFVV